MGIAAAFQAFVKKDVLDTITNQEDFMAAVMVANRLGFDRCRYAYLGCQAMKSVISGPKTQRKVREAIDETRELVVAENRATSQEFVISWILKCKEFMIRADTLDVLPRT